MPTVVGVRLRYAGKVLWFDPADSMPEEGDHVIVTTERGQEYGEVVRAPREIEATELPAELKPVVRLATEVDRQKAASLQERESGELETFRRLVEKHKLDMKPIGVERLFDDSKMIFYFAAEERVDFRELVRDLAAEFHHRIDMRQVGVRDEARMVGGLGHCGQQLCCVRFAGDFQPVSIRMAKEQDLPLNPLKISGLCGRLMCCLRYEYEAYKDFKQRAPKCGSPVETPAGGAKVVALNVPRETVTIRPLEGGAEMTVALEALDCSAGRGCPCVLKADAMVQGSGTSVLAGTRTPPLREAERASAAEGESDRGGSQRRQRESSKPSGGQGGSAQGKRERSQGAERAPDVPKAQPSGGGRRRRRRRPRPEGTDAETV